MRGGSPFRYLRGAVIQPTVGRTAPIAAFELSPKYPAFFGMVQKRQIAISSDLIVYCDLVGADFVATTTIRQTLCFFSTHTATQQGQINFPQPLSTK